MSIETTLVQTYLDNKTSNQFSLGSSNVVGGTLDEEGGGARTVGGGDDVGTCLVDHLLNNISTALEAERLAGHVGDLLVGRQLENISNLSGSRLLVGAARSRSHRS